MNKCYLSTCNNNQSEEEGVYPFCSKEHHEIWSAENYDNKPRSGKFNLKQIQEGLAKLGEEALKRKMAESRKQAEEIAERGGIDVRDLF